MKSDIFELFRGRIAGPAGIALLVLLPAVAAAQGLPDMVSAGKALFEKQFVAGEAITPGGDGLGPVFNHVSCAACHHQGGLGGAGPIDVNAAVLSANPPKLATAPERNEIARALQAVHPGLLSDEGEVTSIILHRFGSDGRYNALRERLLGVTIPLRPTEEEVLELQQNLSRLPVQPLDSARALRLSITQRNTTPLFGNGLIDQVTDGMLRALEAAQSKHPEVSGRVAPVDNKKLGRFGWRGQIEHLHDFVLGACANELGLEVPTTSQPIDPLRPDYKAGGLDLTAPQCLSLTAFVASLPAPKVVKPEDPDKLKAVERGYKVFKTVGCAVCHVETVGQAKGIYSDLLLHDMGQALADPLPARPTYVVVEQRQIPIQSALEQDGIILKNDLVTQATPQYYGGGSTFTSFSARGEGTLYKTSRGYMTVTQDPKNKSTGIRTKYEPVPTNLTQEWRTPPLWGLADSAPYLHDGRAASVVEAIALHGGEAEPTTKRFLALSAADRMAMLEFLNCLQAP